MTGLLALVGGDEFHEGNEPHDRELARAAGGRPAFIVTTAAARQHPDRAYATARAWFARLGLEVVQLPIHTRTDARSERWVAAAASGGFFYLVGGDPGLVPAVLSGTPVWAAIEAAWRGGAALAGSSAGAMALCEWTLVRERYPGHVRRRYRDALGVVPGTAVLPHYDTFGERWIPSALEAPPRPDVLLIGIDERSASVWDGTGWRASGRGRVHLVDAHPRSDFDPGSAVPGIPDPRAG